MWSMVRLGRRLIFPFVEVDVIHVLQAVVGEFALPVLSEARIDRLHVRAKSNQFVILKIRNRAAVIPRLKGEPSEETLVASVLIHRPVASKRNDPAEDWIKALRH